MFGVGAGVAGASWDERESCLVGLFEWGYVVCLMIAMNSNVCEDDFYGSTCTNVGRGMMVCYQEPLKL